MRKACLAALAALTALALAASCGPCGGRIGRKVVEKAIERRVEKETGKKVDIDLKGKEGQIKITGKEGSFEAGEKVAVPDDFPKDVPIYPGAQARMAMKNKDQGVTMMLGSKDSLDQVASFYKKELADKGWKQEAEMTMPEHRMFTCSKENRKVVVSVTKDQEGALISLNHYVEANAPAKAEKPEKPGGES
jgi:hypothetical protein